MKMENSLQSLLKSNFFSYNEQSCNFSCFLEEMVVLQERPVEMECIFHITKLLRNLFSLKTSF